MTQTNEHIDIFNKIIHEVPITDLNLPDLENMKGLLEQEITALSSNKEAFRKLQLRYLQTNNPLSIIPYIYNETYTLGNVYFKRQQDLLKAIKKSIEERCEHIWIDDVYEGPLEVEYKIRYCTKCGNCHKI